MQPSPNRQLTIALYLNAALLATIAAALLTRGRSPFDSVAFGQQFPPIAGGAGFYMMPAQLSQNTWGCYLMDVDAQTLLTYVYDRSGGSSRPQIRLAAARSFANDRQLRNYNTSEPTPAEVEQLVNLERDTARRPEAPATQPSGPENE